MNFQKTHCGIEAHHATTLATTGTLSSDDVSFVFCHEKHPEPTR